MDKRIILSIITSLLVAHVAVATPLAGQADDYTPLAKKRIPISSKGSGSYTLQGADLIDDAPDVTVGGPYTGTTAGYNHDYDEACPYTNSNSPDIVYRFTTAESGNYFFDLCDSGYDTKIYLYDDNVEAEGCNDDACPGYRSYLEILDLEEGIHYIVIDGYGGDAGEYSLTIGQLDDHCVAVECPDDGIDELEDNGGCNSDPPVFQDVCCGDVVCGNAWVESDDEIRDTDWYRLELTEAQDLELTLEVDEFNAVMFLIVPEDDDDECEDFEIICVADEGGYCEGETITTAILEAGVYWIFVAANTFCEDWDGNYVLTVDCEGGEPPGEGDNCEDPFIVDDFPYFDDGNTEDFMDDGFNPSPDVYYLFTTTEDLQFTISLCANSAYDTYLRLLEDDCQTVYAENDDACGLVSEIVDPCLPAGTYYVLIEGYSGNDGYYTLDIITGNPCGESIEGDNCEEPFEIYDFPYQDTQNSADFTNDGFNSSPDVYYHFTMPVEADLTATLCDGPYFDTYLRLLAEDCVTELFSNDDYCGGLSQMDLECLLPGEYYILVEGYSAHCGEYQLDVSMGQECLVTGVEPTEWVLRSNYPNPFNPTTTIEFSLAEPVDASLKVYNVADGLVATLIDGTFPAGEQSVIFDASNLTSGVYFYSLRAGNFSDTKKMILVK